MMISFITCIDLSNIVNGTLLLSIIFIVLIDVCCAGKVNFDDPHDEANAVIIFYDKSTSKAYNNIIESQNLRFVNDFFVNESIDGTFHAISVIGIDLEEIISTIDTSPEQVTVTQVYDHVNSRLKNILLCDWIDKIEKVFGGGKKRTSFIHASIDLIQFGWLNQQLKLISSYLLTPYIHVKLLPTYELDAVKRLLYNRGMRSAVYLFQDEANFQSFASRSIDSHADYKLKISATYIRSDTFIYSFAQIDRVFNKLNGINPLVDAYVIFGDYTFLKLIVSRIGEKQELLSNMHWILVVREFNDHSDDTLLSIVRSFSSFVKDLDVIIWAVNGQGFGASQRMHTNFVKCCSYTSRYQSRDGGGTKKQADDLCWDICAESDEEVNAKLVNTVINNIISNIKLSFQSRDVVNITSPSQLCLNIQFSREISPISTILTSVSTIEKDSSMLASAKKFFVYDVKTSTISIDAPIMLIEMKRHGSSLTSHVVSEWSDRNGIVLYSTPIKTRNKIHLRIGVVEKKPWFMVTKFGHQVHYSGYCYDLLLAIVQELDCTYEIVFSTNFGPGEHPYGGYNSKTGMWFGQIKALVDGEIDLFLADLFITSNRIDVMSLIMPSYDVVGFSAVKYESNSLNGDTRLGKILSNGVWASIVVVMFVTTVLLWYIDRYSPFSCTNVSTTDLKFGDNQSPKNPFLASFLFTVSVFTPLRYGDSFPRSISGRLVICTYWIFSAFILVTFTAALASSLTNERLTSRHKSLVELFNHHPVSFGVVNNTPTLLYFRNMATAEEQILDVWKNLTVYNSKALTIFRLALFDYPIRERFSYILDKIYETGLFPTFDDAIDALSDRKNSNLILINESPSSNYLIARDCNYKNVDSSFAERPITAGLRKNSKLQDVLSRTILKLQENRVIESLQRKYFDLKEECSLNEISRGIDYTSLPGLVVISMCGFIVVVAILIWESAKNNLIPLWNAKFHSFLKRSFLAMNRSL